nr:MAG TPA: hypothetical protein [Caudoviricetes sp.]
MLFYCAVSCFVVRCCVLCSYSCRNISTVAALTFN